MRAAIENFEHIPHQKTDFANVAFKERSEAEKETMRRSTKEDMVIIMAVNGWKVVIKDRPFYLYPPGSVWCKDGIAVAF